MKEIQKLDNRIEVIMTYEGKRYKLNPNGLCYCGKCAFDKIPCSDLPMWEGSQPCADFGGGGFWEEIKDEQAVTNCNRLKMREAVYGMYVCDDCRQEIEAEVEEGDEDEQ